MPIIDSISNSKFDALIRINKAESLLSFIMATHNSRNLDNRKEEVAKRLKSSYELFRENISDTNSGAGSYGQGDRDILSQFNSHYTMGYEMGIWQDSNFNLCPLAEKVAHNDITVKEYIGTVFLNLFSYYEIENEYIYHHYLYSLLKLIKDRSLENEILTKDIVYDSLPDFNKRSEQGNLLFNYLIGTPYFIKIDKDHIKLSEKYSSNIGTLIAKCNLTYLYKSREDAIAMAKDKKEYSKYVTTLNFEDFSLDEMIFKTKLYCNVFSRNRLIYGAPGTGKSYKINKQKSELVVCDNEYERVTFHPDYSYAQFVGTYKPVSYGDTISYEYIPGPFMRVLTSALKSAMSDNPKPHLLIIEEINRANVAAVFGDVFQLLDRDNDGVSEYSIQTSNDMRDYLAKELDLDPSKCTNIRIPNNMFIWATMNSADQGVFPMDTAFKRRWNFEYLDINDGEDKIKGKTVTLGQGDDKRKVEWNDLRVAINDFLVDECRVNEDKLLGPFFIYNGIIKEDEDIDNQAFINIFKNKVLMYLFEDAAKQKRQTLFEGVSKYNLLSSIMKEFDTKGINIFNKEISNKFTKQTGDDH